MIAYKVKTNICLVSVKLLIVGTILCTTVQTCSRTTYMTSTITIIVWFVTLIDLQTTTILFTRNFTQGWLNSYNSLLPLSCPFIVQHNQYNEHSWNRTFVFSPSRELYTDFFCLFIMLRFLTLRFLYLSYSRRCCWFIYN